MRVGAVSNVTFSRTEIRSVASRGSEGAYQFLHRFYVGSIPSAFSGSSFSATPALASGRNQIQAFGRYASGQNRPLVKV